MKNTTSLLQISTCSVLLLSIVACTTPTRATNPKMLESLGCNFPTNCVNSLGSFALQPLRFSGNQAQGMAKLKSVLGTFTEAKIISANDTNIEMEFTTSIGFKDTVSFVLDPSAQLIHFRSWSNIGLFDFGKNSSRMTELTQRFNASDPK
jgi:uncharacterized protein (DUF1499 family)